MPQLTRSRPVAESAIAVAALIAWWACAPIDRSVFEPDAPAQARILPLHIHVIDPNISSVADPSPLVPEVRTLEARYLILKDLTRNLFLDDREEYGRMILRVRREVTNNWGWMVGSTLTLYASALLGVPVYSKSAEVHLDVEIQDTTGQAISRFSAVGENTQYMALYWGRQVTAASKASGNLAGSQMLHAKSMAAALEQIRESLERDAASINRQLRAAPGPLAARRRNGG